jgi:hypothetical protein
MLDEECVLIVDGSPTDAGADGVFDFLDLYSKLLTVYIER